ncbi:MAG: alpha/beta fold hydrolase [Gemmataceae bacterium]|nr:alpha/beta fold hydrolase [Gemmataceae bacterium]
MVESVQGRSWTAADGYIHHFQEYSPQGPAKGILVFIHGIQSHAGWYESSCQWFASQGYRVVFLDRRGSGKNSLHRGDSPSFRTLLADLAAILPWIRKEQPSLPLFLCGISWGGKTALGLEIFHPGLVEGFIFLCPGFCPRISPPFCLRLRIALARLFSPGKMFPIPLNDPALFTSDPQAQEFIRTDPHALRQASARFLFDSVRLDFYLRGFLKPTKKPVLLLLAEKDRIIDNEKTKRFVKKFAPESLQTQLYSGASHTLEFEPEPRQFLSDILGWLDRATLLNQA